jgi:hypothetical protein
LLPFFCPLHSQSSTSSYSSSIDNTDFGEDTADAAVP